MCNPLRRGRIAAKRLVAGLADKVRGVTARNLGDASEIAVKRYSSSCSQYQPDDKATKAFKRASLAAKRAFCRA